MSVAVIVQARTGSSRFPGKVLAPVLGKPLLQWQIERLQRSRLADMVIVATTMGREDLAIVEVALSMGCRLYRGSSGDVLSRYIGAAKAFHADVIVRSTADCPLLDASYIDLLIAQFLASGADYGWLGDHPGGIPNGMGAEAIRLEVLEAIYPLTTAEEREHVTLYVRRHPERFTTTVVETGLRLDDERWTVDDPRDLELVRRVIEALHPKPFTLADINRVLAEHPEWRTLNADVPLGAVDRENLARYARDFQPMLGDL